MNSDCSDFLNNFVASKFLSLNSVVRDSVTEAFFSSASIVKIVQRYRNSIIVTVAVVVCRLSSLALLLLLLLWARNYVPIRIYDEIKCAGRSYTGK